MTYEVELNMDRNFFWETWQSSRGAQTSAHGIWVCHMNIYVPVFAALSVSQSISRLMNERFISTLHNAFLLMFSQMKADDRLKSYGNFKDSLGIHASRKPRCMYGYRQFGEARVEFENASHAKIPRIHLTEKHVDAVPDILEGVAYCCKALGEP